MHFLFLIMLQLFPSLKKVVFLDDDIVIQADLSPLWDIDLKGMVNGAVETCRGEDKFVMSKRLKSYLNFSHPLISEAFDPGECAWAYGMNIFDLDAWRKTNISLTYHSWLLKVCLLMFFELFCNWQLVVCVISTYQLFIFVFVLELEIRFESLAAGDPATRLDSVSWLRSCH